MKRRIFTLILILLLMLSLNAEAAVRIKDIAKFQGVRDNQLIGYGLVVGLNGTGDKSQSVFTVKSIASLLARMGVNVPSAKISPKNVAAVMVTATLPPFIKSGARIDVTLSSLGDASNLAGGTLLLTPLQGADGNVYAVAQGNVVMGTSSGSSNIGTVARIPDGALVEKELPVILMQEGKVNLSIDEVDFTTCIRIAEAVNVHFNENIAKAIDGATVAINVPDLFKNNLIPFLAQIEHIEINPDRKAKIVINERSGTIVGGDEAKIAAVAISHKNINLKIEPQKESKSEDMVSDNKVKSRLTVGDAIFVEDSVPNKKEIEDKYITVGEVAQILNSMGVKPPDMIAIFQAMKKAGAIQAEIEVI